MLTARCRSGFATPTETFEAINNVQNPVTPMNSAKRFDFKSYQPLSCAMKNRHTLYSLIFSPFRMIFYQAHVQGTIP
ncbi:MAG: hypothetical protein WCP01_07965 [Methylococcaceae bacterium]